MGAMRLRCATRRRAAMSKVQVASKGQRRRPVSQAGFDRFELSGRSAIVRRESRREEGRGRKFPKVVTSEKLGYLTYHCVLSKSRDGAGSEVSTFYSGKSQWSRASSLIMIPPSFAQVPAASPPATLAGGAKASDGACSFAQGCR